jgi:hypothetical protein
MFFLLLAAIIGATVLYGGSLYAVSRNSLVLSILDVLPNAVGLGVATLILVYFLRQALAGVPGTWRAGMIRLRRSNQQAPESQRNAAVTEAPEARGSPPRLILLPDNGSADYCPLRSPALNWITTMPNTAELFDTENIRSKTKSHQLQQQSERVRAIISREQQAAEEKISRLRALRRGRNSDE